MRKRYFIPINFIPEGYAFASIRWTNLIQAIVIIIAILVPVFLLLPFGIQGKIYISIILVIPSGFITLMGVNGLSITSYLSDVWETKKYGRIYSKPTNADRISRQKNLERKRHKQIRENEKEQRKIEKEEARFKKNMGRSGEYDTDE